MATATADAPSSGALVRHEDIGFVRLQTLDDAWKFAQMLAKSDLVPKDYKGKPENCVIAMQMGMEIGLPPLQALQGIAVVNGRPSVWGDALRALILSAPDLEDLKESDDGTEATCSIKRKGRSVVVRTFSMDEARAAGLLSKESPWKSYPKRMRQLRAFTFAARDAFADRLKGLASAEEQQDINPPPTPSEPRRVGEGATPAAQAAHSSPKQPAESPASTTPPVAAAPVATSAAVPPSNGGVKPDDFVVRRLKVKNTVFVAKKDNDPEYWEVVIFTANGDESTFATADEQLHKSIATCIDTDHEFWIAWRWGTLPSGKRLRKIIDFTPDEDLPTEAQQGELLK